MIQVASYCRVSTDRDDQTNSFEAQQRYFKAYIERQPDWKLYRVYADAGITGTSTKKRVQFNEMIHDARMGKFKLILTKEVSRFSRNILDTIAFTRELKALGVGVLFMNDGISTLEPDAELRLSIMASIAQEESRKTSARVKWGQTRQMERGVVFGRSLLGYDVKDGKLEINPEGAQVVRLIFYKYGIEKKGSSVIARELQESGYRTCRGNIKWSSSHILKILKNEKYVGDLVQKKTYTPDYLTHAKRYNHGEEKQIVLENHHAPIIDRKLWMIVQDEIQRRNVHAAGGVGHSNRYAFSGKIKCGMCGSSFISRKKYRKDGSFCRYWGCFTAANEGRKHLNAQNHEVGCNVGKLLREDAAMEVLKCTLKTLQMDRACILDTVTEAAAASINIGRQNKEKTVRELNNKIQYITKKKQDVLDAFFSKEITKEDMACLKERYNGQLEVLSRQLEAEKANIHINGDETDERDAVRKQAADILSGKVESEVFYQCILDHMVVYQDGKIEVELNHLPQKWIFIFEKLKPTNSDKEH